MPCECNPCGCLKTLRFLGEEINFQRFYAHYILLRTLPFSLVPVVPPITTAELGIWLSISSHPAWHLCWVLLPLHLSH